MLGNILGGLADVSGDVLRVATAPVEVAVDVTRAVSKPAAELAQAAVNEVQSVTDESKKIG